MSQTLHPDEAAFFQSRLHYTQDKDGKPSCLTTEEKDSASQIILIEKLMNILIQSDKPIFLIKENLSNGKRAFHPTDIGKALLRYTTSVLRKIERHFPNHTFTPNVATFISYAKSFEFKLERDALMRLSGTELSDAVFDLNAFVHTLRTQLCTDQQRQAAARCKRNARYNNGSTLEYLEAWLSKHSKLLVLKIDLSYGEAANHSINGRPGKPYTAMTEEIQHHRRIFFKYLCNRFKGEKIGYAWKLEYGLFKGFHCHVIILLNGDKHRDDVNLVKQLGQCWNTIITEGKGLHYNFNADKDDYAYPAVGLLHACDLNKWTGLTHIARYLTKPDGYLKLELPDNRRTFGKGNMPKTSDVSRGRPHFKE
nr:inovirus-type Gp2 protein [uncultured Albidiferax sp.]